jgi:hypothetical protein
MKLLINTTDSLQDYINISSSMKMETVKPSILFAQREYIQPLLGATVIERLTSEDGNLSGLEVIDQTLLDIVKPPLVRLGFLEAVDELDVTVSAGGFKVAKGEHQEIASQHRVSKFKEQLFRKSQKDLDRLIDFLIDNEEAIEEYDGSNEALKLKTGFLANARDMQPCVTYSIGQYVFTKLRPVAEVIESREVLPILCKPLFDQLIQSKMNGQLPLVGNINYSPIVPLVQKAVSYRVLEEAVDLMKVQLDPSGLYVQYQESNESIKRTESINDNTRFQLKIKFKNEADRLFEELKKHLIENANTYTLWATSDCASIGTLNKVTNTSEGGIVPLFGI